MLDGLRISHDSKIGKREEQSRRSAIATHDKRSSKRQYGSKDREQIDAAGLREVTRPMPGSEVDKSSETLAPEEDDDEQDAPGSPDD